MADYLKIPELARRLDVSEKTARRYIKGGALPSTFIGGAYRVTEEDLERFLRQAEVRPEDASPKAQAPPSSTQPPLNGFEEERRSPLIPWARYARRMASRIRYHTDDPNSGAFRDAWAALFFVEERNRDAAELWGLLFEEELERETFDEEPLTVFNAVLAAFEELVEALAEAQQRAEQMAAGFAESEIGQARRRAAEAVAQREQATARVATGLETHGA